MKYTARQPVTNVNVTPASPLREFFILSGSLLGFVVAIYILLGILMDFLVPYLPPELETKMAGPFLSSLPGKESNAKEEQAVQELLNGLLACSGNLPYTFKVHVCEDEAINALALPGGHIIVFTGLLKKVTSENELAFVLAHELGHYAHRDHLRGLGRSFLLFTTSAALLGADSGVVKMLAHGLNLTEMSFSRKQESLADAFGLEVVNCAYGHVSGARDFFDKMEKENDPGMFGHYFSSHPENRKRISHLEDLMRSRGFCQGEKKSLVILSGP